MRHGKYLKREVLNLARFIAVMKFRPLSWRQTHGYLVRVQQPWQRHWHSSLAC